MGEKKNFKKKLEFFIIPIIFFFLVTGIIFFEIIRLAKEPRIKIEVKNLTNEEKEDLKEAYSVFFQIKLMKKELSGLEEKYKKENLPLTEIYALEEKIEKFKRNLIEEKDISQIKKISQTFWDSGIWEEILTLSKRF